MINAKETLAILITCKLDASAINVNTETEIRQTHRKKQVKINNATAARK